MLKISTLPRLSKLDPRLQNARVGGLPERLHAAHQDVGVAVPTWRGIAGPLDEHSQSSAHNGNRMLPRHVVLDGQRTLLEWALLWIAAVASLITPLVVVLIMSRNQRRLQTAQDRWQLLANSSIERLKSDLQIELVRFSKLHEKRAEIIAEVYKRSVDAEREVRSYVYQFGARPKNEQGEEPATVALLSFGIFVEQHRVFLPECAYRSLVGFSARLTPFAALDSQQGSVDNPPLDIVLERREVFKKALESFEKEIPAARRELDREFRRILGVDS